MRRIIVLLLVMWASSPAQAAPLVPGELFTPGFGFLTVGAPQFENSSNTFCWQCDDGNPSNDLHLFIGDTKPIIPIEGFPTFFTADGLGSMPVSGPALDFTGLNVAFSFPVKSTITTKVNPDHSFEKLPRPSVAEGLILCLLVGRPGRELVGFYGGRVDGVSIQNAFTNEFTVPIEGGTKPLFAEIFLDEQIPYTPGPFTPGPSVVPDPASLVLLGSGLGAVAIRRRVARRRATRTASA